MNYDVMADKVAIGAAQGAGGGGMGMVLGGFNGLMQGVSDEQAMKDQYFQQLKLNNMSQMFNKDMYNFQMNKQLDFWDKTNYTAQVEQLKKAGLNPALLYGKGGGMGASTGSASAGNMQSHAGSDTDRMQLAVQRQNQAMQMSLLLSQKANIEADTELKRADAAKTAGVDTEKTKTETINIAQATENSKVAQEGLKLDNALKEIELYVSKGTADLSIDKLEKEVYYAQKLIEKIEIELPYVGQQAQATLNNTIAGTKLVEQNTKTSKAEERLKFQQGSAQVFENSKDQRDLRTAEKNARIQNETEKAITQSLQNKYFKEYGIVPGSGMATTISTLIAKFVDDNGNRLLAGDKEVLRELENLLKAAQKESEDVLNKVKIGKFWWE